jgi:hypothetical protein
MLTRGADIVNSDFLISILSIFFIIFIIFIFVAARPESTITIILQIGKGQKLLAHENLQAARPERAEAPSPGQRPG